MSVTVVSFVTKITDVLLRSDLVSEISLYDWLCNSRIFKCIKVHQKKGKTMSNQFSSFRAVVYFTVYMHVRMPCPHRFKTFRKQSLY